MDKAPFEARAISVFHERKYVFYDELQKGGDSEIKAELLKLRELCDLIGIDSSSGGVNLVLFVYSDDLTDETIIGKCRLIRDKLSSFKKFSMRIGWNRLPVRATVFSVFTKSERAFHFRQCAQAHCKHFGLFNKLWVLPWGIDLAAKSVWPYRGWPVNWMKPTEIEARLFS